MVSDQGGVIEIPVLGTKEPQFMQISYRLCWLSLVAGYKRL